MNRAPLVCQLLFAVLLAACSGKHSGFPSDHCSSDCPTGNEMLAIAPARTLLLAGSERQLQAVLVASDGSRRDVSDSVEWRSNNATLVTVSADGVVTGVATGATTVTASLPTLEAHAEVAVTNLSVDQLVVSPAHRKLLPGLPQQYTATAVLSNGSTVDVTTRVQWLASDPTVASIDSSGRAVAITEGETQIDARLLPPGAAEHDAEATLDVRPPIVTIDSFYLEPASTTSVPGARIAFRAFVITSENETLDVTEATEWQSTNTSVADIDAGIATAHAVGSTVIQARVTRLGQQHLATSDLTVVAPSLSELRIDPQWAEQFVGQKQAYRATAIMASGLSVDVTNRVLWSSASPSVAAIDHNGVASALAAGEATISASLSLQGMSYSDEAVFVVVTPPPVLQSLSVVPSNASVLVGDDLAYRCLATFSDGTVRDVTGSCVWSVSDPAIAVIDGLSGLLTGIAAGSAQVGARWSNQGVAVVGATAVEVIDPVTVTALQVTPASAQSLVLGTQQFLAHALLSNGRKLDVTSNVAWTSSDPAIATVGELGLARARAPGHAEIRAEVRYQGVDLADAASFSVTAPDVIVEEFRIVPPTQTTYDGATAKFDAQLLLSNGRTLNVTTMVNWSSLALSVARSTATAGEFIGLQAGIAPVTAAFSYHGTNYSARSELIVLDRGRGVGGLEVVPAKPLLVVGGQRQLRSLLLLNNGDYVDVTDRSPWVSVNDGTASVDAQGLVTGVTAGTTVVATRVSAGPVQDIAEALTRVVDPAAELVALRVAPARASALVGATTQFTATAYYLNGQRDDVSSEVSWSIADPDIATAMSQDGLVLATAEGTTTVSARYRAGDKELTASAMLDVTSVTITEIQVTPAQQIVAAGNAAPFTATAILSDNSHIDVSADVQWRSSNTAVAQASLPPGLFETLAQGTTTISATLTHEGEQFVGRGVLIVQAAQAVALEISPPQLRLTVGQLGTLRAIVHFSDNTTEDVTREVSWRSADATIAAVNATLNKGLVTGESVGVTAISAVYRESLSASASAQVVAPVLLSIDVLPAAASIASGLTHEFTAIGNYDDESALDITDRALWSSSNDAVATIVAGDTQGLVQGVSTGISTVSATLDGIVGNAMLTVTPATVVGLEVGPDPTRMLVGDERAFTAVALLSDGSRREVTSEVTWMSSNAGVASVSNRVGSAGVAQGLAAGTAQIRATYRRSLQDEATLQVLAPIINAIVVTPANETVTVGSNVYYTATAILSDTTQLDVTRVVSWRSSNVATAAVSNVEVNKGRATALAAGTTTITATLGTSSGRANLTVSAACNGKPDSVFIVSDLTLRVGETAQMRVTGVFPDGCMQDLTEESATVWDSSNNDVFTIGNKSGVVTGIGPGVAQADVKHRSSTDTAVVTVFP